MHYIIFLYAANGDYTTSQIQVTFPRLSGDGTTLNFEIPIFDDIFIENTENFMLSASAVNDRGNFSADGDTASAFIIDNDGKYKNYMHACMHAT